MNSTFRSLLTATTLAAGLALSPDAFAQTARPDGTTTTPARPADTATRSTSSEMVDANTLESGANSFTEGQVRSRLEAAGLSNVQGLRKADNGIWIGRATRNGAETDVAMDFRGHMAAGTGVAALASRPDNATRAGTTGTTTGATTGTTMGTTTGTTGTTMGTRPDGTPGNPPSTMTGRAVDRAQGEAPRPDGTPGNPPGTAVGRAIDGTLGTNTTGANPGGSRPDGAPGNPPSTMTGRAVDRAQGEAPRPDGTPGNPPGTAAGRAMDRTLGTNTTGANPTGTNPTGTNPAGTAPTR